jgi:copper transport protein
VRYSRVALVSVGVLVATGIFAALAESGISLRALVETGYGRILLGKIGLFGLTLPIANVNRTRNVPAIVAGTVHAPHALRRFVRYEMLILVTVLGLTAWLVDTVPARHAVHQVAAAPAGPVSETRTLPSGARVTLSIDPAAVGPNAVVVRVVTATGEPDTSVSGLTLNANLMSRNVDRLPLEVKRRAPGRWQGSGLAIPLAGNWRFDIALRRGEFDEERTHVDAEIAAPTQP